MNTNDTVTTPITLNKLEKSPLNARRTGGGDGIGELKASIESHGLMHNLVVTDAGDGTYLVIDGGRRLEALRILRAEGTLPADHAVACQIVSEEHAVEMSLAANIVRLAMHPADQYEIFAELIEQGSTADKVALRFGIDVRHVLKMMTLGRVAPKLRQAFRDDELSLQCLMAFTVTDDHKRQLKVYNSLQGWQKDDPAHIRACLTEKMIDAGSKLAAFVGIDAYTAAGGSTRADLFNEDVYLENPAILHKLANAKLNALRQELEADDWGWIEVTPDRDWNFINKCSRIQPLLIEVPQELLEFKEGLEAELEEIGQALDDTESDALIEHQEAIQRQLDEAEQKIASFVGFDPEMKKLAGCCISLNQNGTPFIDKGLVKPEHKKQLACLQRQDDAGGEPAAAEVSKDRMPESLRRDLAGYRLQIAQVEMARHPAIALDLLAFHAASSLLSHATPADGPDVHFRQAQLAVLVQNDVTAAGDALKAIEATLPQEWAAHRTENARFAAFRSLSDADKQSILAYCVAMTLQPRLAPDADAKATAYDDALSLTEGNVAAYWRPTTANYFRRVTRDQLLAIGREVLGDAWSQSRSKDKKSELADQLERAFANPDKAGRPPVQVEKLTRWLPARMEFGAIAPAAKPAKAKKSRKAA
jgi:ParB family chromosome partitioning protein